ncbi:diguanylate cyclase domain-containing protein [Paraburkholderia youngii]|uniref:Diguanylate cyclase (GGDEF)-like protein n=1 Tax=Paraburkholderia youngii TaxID=2782701 RepID=A0A7W8P5V1_9BURK|nr:diguanylate cyclase [Paraburkholderia youngii]MBB5404746.1 diguanylate cyclase (GGDEF)-like protein [Paraburkholderia youngii]
MNKYEVLPRRQLLDSSGVVGMAEADLHSWREQAMLRVFPKNPEKEQAILRMVFGTVVLLAYLAFTLFCHSTVAYSTMVTVAIYVVFGIVTYVATKVGPARSHLRLTLTTVVDQATVTTALAIGGRAALPLLWVVFWFLVGAGCRYGRRMLALSCAVALAGFVSLMYWQPWWRTNIEAGLGLTFSVAAISLYLAVLVYRLEKRAATDPLTGLSNRLRLEQVIGRTLTGRGTEVGQTALFLIDLDGFKEVNDAHGHAVGDELLRSFAMALVSRMRRGDTLARLGGDEFVVLAHHVYDQEGALRIADSIHVILSNVRTAGGHPTAVSASIGVCMLLTEGTGGSSLDAQTLMRAADSAMYRAKTRGKGQTEFADATDMQPLC